MKRPLICAAKIATVVFDPSITTLKTIAAASRNAGYPAQSASGTGLASR